jgi:hypothetical protein
MNLRRVDPSHSRPPVGELGRRRVDTVAARDVYGRTLDDARETDQQDYLQRKSRVEGLGHGQARLLCFCCWLLAATVPVSLLSPEWMPMWWPLAVFGTCAGTFVLVGLMRWLLALCAGWLGVEPPAPPDQTTLQALHSGTPSVTSPAMKTRVNENAPPPARRE